MKVFEGTCTALVTPFNSKGKIDWLATKRLVEMQLRNRVNAILVLGSTGEGMAISSEERKNFIRFVRSLLHEDCKLIVGAGSNNPEEAIRLIGEAKKYGANACLVQTPYFCKCTQNGIVKHFKTICERSALPIIVYNIPSRSGVNILPNTMLEMCKLPQIAGLKEANGDINHILSMTHTLDGKLPLYCGNDNLYQLFLSLGASGTISVTSNIFPAKIAKMWAKRGQMDECLKMHDKLFDINNLMFCEPNPIPVKYALSRLGVIENVVRPPLTPLEEGHKKEIDSALGALLPKTEAKSNCKI